MSNIFNIANIIVVETLSVAYNGGMFFNKTSFKFLLGFIAIILVSFIVSFVVGYFERGSQLSDNNPATEAIDR